MGLISAKTFNLGQGDRTRKFSASHEEGRRLIEAFLLVERADRREAIFKFVIKMLRAQEKGANQQWIL
jgi:hypothetical protein